MATKTRKKPASSLQQTRSEPETGASGDPTPDATPSAEAIRQAVDELGITRPFYSCRLVGNRLEFSLYGGDLVYWSPSSSPNPPAGRTRGRAKQQEKED